MEYCYPIGHLNPHGDDLAVYRDEAHRIPFVLLRTDDDGTPGGHRPLLDQASTEGFEFAAVVAGERLEPYHAGMIGAEPRAAKDIPIWSPAHPRGKLISRSKALLPFRDEHEARAVFDACHGSVHRGLANDPAAAFDLMLLAIAGKIMDEMGDGPAYEFARIKGEDERSCRERVWALLESADEWLGLHAGSSLVAALGHVPDRVACDVVDAFQDYSFLASGGGKLGADIIGTAYETMVGSTFRGELGSYFTPRNIGEFLVRMLDVREGQCLDPACGSGGLLVLAKAYAAAMNGTASEDGAGVNCFGNDLNARMVRAARLSFLLHDMPADNVLHGDGLQLDRMLTRWFGRSMETGEGPWWRVIQEGMFDCVLANPPFAGHEQDPLNLRRTETAVRDDGSLRSLNRTIPFLEAIVASLKPGGRAGIVVPTSILNAEEESFQRFRKLLLEHVELLAIVGLPERAFVHTDCGVHGALLFFRRITSPRSEYDVFVDWAGNLGYDQKGRMKPENDLPGIVERYHSPSWPAANTFPVSLLVKYGRWDPAWLRLSRSLPGAEGNRGEEFVRLTDLIRVRDGRFDRRTLDDRRVYRYFEVCDADLLTGVVKKVHEGTGLELRRKSRIKNVVREGDILFPNHRDSLIAKGAPAGRATVPIDAKFDGVYTTDRFIVLEPLVEPLLARVVLNSIGVRRQMVAQCRGAASLDIREKTLESVLVPRKMLEDPMRDTLMRLAQEELSLRARAEATASQLRADVESFFGGGHDLRPEELDDL